MTGMRVIETPTLILEPQAVAHAAEMFVVLCDPAACTSRLSRVASVLASVIHSTYSLCFETLKPTKVVSAFLLFFTAARK